MKKLLLLSVTLLSLFANGQTSVYHPFPDSNAVWNIHFTANCFSNGNGDESYSISISGDTLINSLTYQKLITQFKISFSTGTCFGPAIGYKGAIREDTANRKIFFVPPSQNTEQLLYDFTMQVGDTVGGYIESQVIVSPDVVQSIDSVLVGSTYRKRWNTNSYYDVHFIEGIGSTYGLIAQSPGSGPIADLPEYTITCFQQNGQTLYPDTLTNCDLITSVSSLEKNIIKIKVFPNPSNGKFIIETENMGNIEIEIYNVLAEKISTISHFKQQVLNEIDLSNSPKGIYFIKIYDGVEIHTEKILIQ